jgi:hypothetical protein
MQNHRLFLVFVILVGFFSWKTLFLCSTPAFADENAQNDAALTPASASVHTLIAGLSDEQVRRMLIAELQKTTNNNENEFTLEPEIRGPGAPLDALLRALNRESAQSGHQLHSLWVAIPALLPDLYKVFITL